MNVPHDEDLSSNVYETSLEFDRDECRVLTFLARGPVKLQSLDSVC